MKKIAILICYLLLQNGLIFAQTQRTNFVYPEGDFTLNYTFSKDNGTHQFIWLQNELGVYCLDYDLKKSHKVMLFDSVSAKKLISVSVNEQGIGSIVLGDSLDNYYICSAQKNRINIEYAIYKPLVDFRRTPVLLSAQNDERLLFFDKNILFQFKKGILSKLDYLTEPLTLQVSQSNWVATNKDTLQYNGLKRVINPLFIENDKPKVTFRLFKDDVYAYSDKKLWYLSIKNGRIQSDSLSIGASVSNLIYQQNDSLLLRRTSPQTFALTIYHINKKALEFIQAKPSDSSFPFWTDGKISIQFGKYYDLYYNVDIYAEKNKNQSQKNILFERIEYSTQKLNFELNSVTKKDSTYLISIDANDRNYLVLARMTKDSILTLTVEVIRKINKSALLIRNIFNYNNFKLLDLNTLKQTEFITFQEKSTFKKFLPSNSDPEFWIGNKNLAYKSSGYPLKLISNFRTNSELIPIISQSYSSQQNEVIFANDTLIEVNREPLNYTTIYLSGQQNIYHSARLVENVLKLFDIESRKWIEINLGLIDTYARITVYVLKKGEVAILSTAFNNYNSLLFWKNGLLKTVNTPPDIQLFTSNDKLWLFTQKKNSREINVNLLTENGELSPKLAFRLGLNSYYRFEKINDPYFTIQIGESKKILRLKDEQATFIPEFEIAPFAPVWTDSENEVYYLDYNSKTGINTIYSSKNPVVPFLQNVPKPFTTRGTSGTLLATSGDVYFATSENNKFEIIKYVKALDKYFYINDVDLLFSYDKSKDNLYFKKLKGKEIFLYKISKEGETQLNEKPIKINNYKFQNDILFVSGNLKGGTTQIFELEAKNAVPAEFSWLPYQSKPLIITEEQALEKAISEAQVLIYPNPFSDAVNIKFIDVPGITQVGIYNAAGQTVWFDFAGSFIKTYPSDIFIERTQRENLTVLINTKLKTLPAGVYFITFYFSEFYWSKSLTVKVLKI